MPLSRSIATGCFSAGSLALVVLVLGLALAAGAARAVAVQNADAVRNRFTGMAERLHHEVQRRFSQPLSGLQGARGLFAASRSVERLEYNAFFQVRDLATDFPGVRGFGFIQPVLRQNLDAFVAAQRADDAPGFDVRSSGDAEVLYVITYIVPYLYNRQAFGYDIGSEARRRAAAVRAVDTGKATLTRVITLVQDDSKGPGYLLMLPIFRNGAVTTTPELRRRELVGLVYCPIVVADLMRNVEAAADRLLACQLIDDGEEVVYDSRGAPAWTDGGPKENTDTTIAVGGRDLRLRISPTPAFAAQSADRSAWLVAIGGCLLSLFGALAIWQLGRGRSRAQALAIEMTRDLAAAKTRAEDALRESETLHQTLQKHAIVSMADARGRIIAVNDAFCTISGYSREELIGRDHRIVNSGHHPKGFWASAWATIASGKAWRGDVCNRAKDGRLYWADSIIAPFCGPDGRIEKYVSISSDITQRKQAQAEMAALNQELGQQTVMANDMAARAELASSAKSSFLANMSHEIRTPMNGVLGMTELLLGMGLTAEQEDAARTVYRSAESLLTILNDILDFSKIEAGRLDLERIPFDIQQLIFDVAELFLGRLSGGAVELLVRIAPESPARLIGDPGRIRQILTNLVGNAVKFTTTGHVLIELSADPEGCQFAVTDTGVGIPADRQQALFQPFTQADASTSRRYGGTGLGLAICKSLAEAMGGAISLESAEGSGSTFRVRLRLAADSSQAPPMAAVSSLAGKRILVVDDNAVNRAILSEQLGALGGLTVAADGATAAMQQLALTTGFDAAILDNHMPLTDGLTLAANIRQDPRHRALPLVLLSSSGVRGEASSMEAAGFAGYLVKPAPRAVLASVLATAIERTRSGVAALVTRHQVAEAGPARVDATAKPYAGMRVLLAEDNPVNQRVARSLLERLGCIVTVAGDGRVAVDTWAPDAFDIIFMDCQMPVMDGFEATTAIRSAEARHHDRTVIVAMTANAADEDRERCLAVGMDGHVAKPARSQDLADALARVRRGPAT